MDEKLPGRSIILEIYSLLTSNGAWSLVAINHDYERKSLRLITAIRQDWHGLSQGLWSHEMPTVALPSHLRSYGFHL